MHNSNIEEIRGEILLGVSCQFLPMFLLRLLQPWLESLSGSETIISLFTLLVFIIFLCGYGLCAGAANKYATYKGYKNPWFIFSILNILGLAILFLLKDKINNLKMPEPL
ncbi:MAG: hypothetical protein AAGE84_26655 [Cyanobacteria bacterium P01_G01_bin.39]